MYKTLNFILIPLLFVEVILLRFYKLIISPFFSGSCTFIPSCSNYFLRAILRFGAIYGVFIGFRRLKRCNGKNKGEIDLEPLNILGDFKWVC